MANENYGQFMAGGVPAGTDYVVGYTPPGVAGAERRWLVSDLLSGVGGVTSAIGTANQVAVSSATGAVTFSLPSTLVLPSGTTATTQTLGDNTTKVATTAFVIANAGGGGGVTSLAGTSGQVVASAATGAVTLSLAAALTGINSVTSATGQPLTLATLDTNQNILVTPNGTGYSVFTNGISIPNAGIPRSVGTLGIYSYVDVTTSIGANHAVGFTIIGLSGAGSAGYYAENNVGNFMLLSVDGTSLRNGHTLLYNSTSVDIYAGNTLASIISSTGISVSGGANPLLSTLAAANDGAGVGVGTLTTAPHAGNPDKWLPFNDNSVAGWIPWWHA